MQHLPRLSELRASFDGLITKELVTGFFLTIGVLILANVGKIAELIIGAKREKAKADAELALMRERRLQKIERDLNAAWAAVRATRTELKLENKNEGERQ